MVAGSATMPDGNSVSYDGLLQNRFSIVFDKLPNVLFFLQGFKMPSIEVGEVEVPTRYVDMNEIGEKLHFEPYTINFLVDSNMRNWTEVFAWMKRMTVQGSNVGETSDATIFFNGVPKLQFVGCWPTSLGGLDFDVTPEESNYVYSTVTVNYDYLNVLDSSVENY